MRFLICGLGSVGRRHLRNLESLGHSDVVLYRTGKGTLPKEELDRYRVESDLEIALDRWSPDAVIVANPTALHLEVAIPAARRGCHLLLEKPISHQTDQVDEFRTAVGAGGGKVLVGFQYRYHPALMRAKQLLEDNTVGQPLYARSAYGDYLPDWHGWEDYRQSYSAREDLGGGVLLTLCHPFDYLRWMMGEVRSVDATAVSGRALGLEVESVALVTLEFDEEVLAGVSLDYHQRPPRHALEIICTEGTIRWTQAEGGLRWWSSDRAEWQVEDLPPGYERNAMFLEEMRHFLGVIAGEADPVCTLEDGIRALEISLAAKSAAQGKGRVKLQNEPA